jgi:polyketide cyclase/dehydrase/lipid transport protein
MPGYTVRREVRAPRDVVFAVLTDHEGYTALTPLHWTLERAGTPHPNGVGAIRAIRPARRAPFAVREQVTEYEAPSRFGYKVISGAPVRSHVGTVTLAETQHGTEIEYRMDAVPRIPLPTKLITAGLRGLITMLLRGVTKEAESRSRERGAAF